MGLFSRSADWWNGKGNLRAVADRSETFIANGRGSVQLSGRPAIEVQICVTKESLYLNYVVPGEKLGFVRFPWSSIATISADADRSAQVINYWGVEGAPAYAYDPDSGQLEEIPAFDFIKAVGGFWVGSTKLVNAMLGAARGAGVVDDSF